MSNDLKYLMFSHSKQDKEIDFTNFFFTWGSSLYCKNDKENENHNAAVQEVFMLCSGGHFSQDTPICLEDLKGKRITNKKKGNSFIYLVTQKDYNTSIELSQKLTWM